MNKRLTICTVLNLMLAVWASGLPAADDDDAQRTFTLRVLPLLKQKCLGCHGGDASDIKGDFSVVDRQALLRGGESSEPAIVPGQPDAGTLMEAITWSGLEMPPKENDRLNEQEIELIRHWISVGAPWPNEAAQEKYRREESLRKVTADGMVVSTSGGLSEDWTHRRYQPEDLWAFAPLRTPEQILPQEIPHERAIDFLVDKTLSKAGLVRTRPASARQLIRRVTLDLTGLPPTPEEVAVFESDFKSDSDRALTELVDRLLASPRYGEHWGRHWLDVTRYADTGGMSNDYERSNMWRYRDYVIRSFNNDKPYNDFIIEQLAGDELADQSVQQRSGGKLKDVHAIQLNGDYNQQEAEWIVASGFLRLGPWDNAMVEATEARQMFLDDLVNITGQTFLAQTLRCCKCHDHKFDPIPTRDYYRIYAAFSTTHMAERPVPFVNAESKERFESGKAHVQRMLDFATAERDRLITKRETAARKWFEEHGLPYKDESARKELPDDEKPPRHVGLDHVEQGQLKVREQDVWIWTRRLERYEPMAQSVFNAGAAALAWNGARKLRIDRKTKAKQPLVNHILVGGALTALGDPVLPGVLSATSLAASTSATDPYVLNDAIEGRRLQLAQWIANPKNPLTARAMVNRIWQYHFGTGIAANANNFGAKGAHPSHPDLLDFLAADFVQHGWKIKRMHRLIINSQTYRQSTVPENSQQQDKLDPNNRLLAHFPRRRLSAEELRDSMLSITGELVSSDGGVPVMPEINMEVALQPRMIQFSLAPAYQPSATARERNCRTVFAYHVRGQADPFSELFNQPNPNESCELRESAAVTPQAFTLLNSDMITDRAIAFAQRLQQEAIDIESQIDRAFWLCLCRAATEPEITHLTSYVNDMQDYHSRTVVPPKDYPTKITRSLVEEFSGQPFQYEEILPVFERYQPDTKAHDVSAKTRALADMCLLLLNTNEFMYVD